jgi:hypothetical protein
MDSNQEMYKQKYLKYKKKYLGLKTQIDEIEGGKKKKKKFDGAANFFPEIGKFFRKTLKALAKEYKTDKKKREKWLKNIEGRIGLDFLPDGDKATLKELKGGIKSARNRYNKVVGQCDTGGYNTSAMRIKSEYTNRLNYLEPKSLRKQFAIEPYAATEAEIKAGEQKFAIPLKYAKKTWKKNMLTSYFKKEDLPLYIRYLYTMEKFVEALSKGVNAALLKPEWGDAITYAKKNKCRYDTFEEILPPPWEKGPLVKRWERDPMAFIKFKNSGDLQKMKDGYAAQKADYEKSDKEQPAKYAAIKAAMKRR